jgi:uncharacterized protein with GYD domain
LSGAGESLHRRERAIDICRWRKGERRDSSTIPCCQTISSDGYGAYDRRARIKLLRYYRSIQMSHFMVSCNYSTESKNALIANPVDRAKVASAAIEAVGGKLHSAFMTFGETDIIVIYEAPDAIASAALAMTLGASGAFSSIKTTALLTTEEGIKALKLSADTKTAYRPPSR